jgi:hypothetical protein
MLPVVCRILASLSHCWFVVFKSGVLIFFYSFSESMVRRRISEAQRWQIIGMHTTGMSFKAIGRQMGYHYIVVNTMPNVIVNVGLPTVDV